MPCIWIIAGALLVGVGANPNGTIAVYTYDEQNRLDTLINYRGSVAAGNEMSTFDYDVGPAGNRKGVVETIKPVGDPGTSTALQRTITYGYDDLYRLTREHVVEDDGATVETKLDVTYVYNNKVGNRDVMIRDEGGCRQTTTYYYDDNDRLTSSGTVTVALNWDMQKKFDRMYAGRPRGWTRTFAAVFAGLTLTAFWAPLLLPWCRRRNPNRDRKGAANQSRGRKPMDNQSRDCKGADSGLPLGRRAHRKRIRHACIATFLVPLMAVSPDAAHALTTEAVQAQIAIAAGVQLDCDPSVTTSYDYDLNGNQLAKTRTDGSTSETDYYLFDFQNRLAGAVTSIATTANVRYSYDADGARKSKRHVGGEDRAFLTDKNRSYTQVIGERIDTTPPLEYDVTYTYGDDLVSQTRVSGTVTRYYHYDGQMSTRQLTDDNAAPGSVVVTDRYAYDAFGVGSVSEGLTDNAYRYTGEQFDKDILQYYLRARCYDPAIGRFHSFDPYRGDITRPSSLHKYQYAGTNPVNYIDPSGLLEFSIGGLLSSVAVMSSLGALVGVVVGGAVAGARGMLIGAVAGTALGLAFATSRLIPVILAGLWQGAIALFAEYLVHGTYKLAGWTSSLSASKALDVFFSQFAYGAFSAAIQPKFDVEGVLAVMPAVAASLVSVVNEILTAFARSAKPDWSSLLLGALATFFFALATTPDVLFSGPSGRFVDAIKKKLPTDEIASAAWKAFLSWATASVFGMGPSMLTISVDKHLKL